LEQAKIGFVFNWFGRVCNIAKREWAYVLPNHLIQGSGADICKVALVGIAKLLATRGAQSKIVLTVHDSIILEMVPEEFHLIPEITKIMETVYTSKHGIVLTTDLEYSYKSLAKRDLIKGAPSERVA
jgi:DNA polymerase I-like protein with 3'-5' exonuclease and polymerase domains